MNVKYVRLGSYHVLVFVIFHVLQGTELLCLVYIQGLNWAKLKNVTLYFLSRALTQNMGRPHIPCTYVTAYHSYSPRL